MITKKPLRSLQCNSAHLITSKGAHLTASQNILIQNKTRLFRSWSNLKNMFLKQQNGESSSSVMPYVLLLTSWTSPKDPLMEFFFLKCHHRYDQFPNETVHFLKLLFTEVIGFVNHKYDYRQNRTKWSPVTNQLKLWQNLSKKLDIGYTFS